MLTGMSVGGIIWSVCFSIFFVFPNPLSFVLAFFIGPCATGYLGGRLGGRGTAYALTLFGTIAALALSVVYLPSTSWGYPHHLWAGVFLFATLLILGNAIFISFGGLVGIQGREYSKLKQTRSKTKVAEQKRGDYLRGTAPHTRDPVQARIDELGRRESDLRNDLTIIAAKKGLEQIPPELLEERQKVLQSQLLDTVLEKERLIRQSGEEPRPAKADSV